MPLDSAGERPDSHGVAIGAAVRETLHAHPTIKSVRTLAKTLGHPGDTRLNRTLRGLHPMTVALVSEMEQALGLARGELLIRAGLVDLPTTTEQMLSVDPALPAEHRRTVLHLYRSLVVDASQNSIQSRSTRTRTAKTTDRS